MDTSAENGVRLLFTLNHVAKLLSVSRRTIEREISSGRFPKPFKIGNRSLVKVADLEAYLSRGSVDVGRSE